MFGGCVDLRQERKIWLKWNNGHVTSGVGGWERPWTCRSISACALVQSEDLDGGLACSGKYLTQVFLFPYSWSSIWSNLSPGAELICSTLALCQVQPSHLLSLLCPVPNPSSLPLHSFLLIPLFSRQPLTAACLSAVTASAFILKVRYKENLQEPDIKNAQEVSPQVASRLEVFEIYF